MEYFLFVIIILISFGLFVVWICKTDDKQNRKSSEPLKNGDLPSKSSDVIEAKDNVILHSIVENNVDSPAEDVENTESNANDMSSSRSSPKGISFFSLLALFVSLLGCGLFSLAFEIDVIRPWVVVSVISIILPVIAKIVRLKHNKKGKVVEIISIVIGGFNFYCIVSYVTQLPIIIAYLGWVVCGIVYKCIKK